MNRAEQVCNKVVQARVQKKKLRTLRRRLKQVKGSVDSAPPKSLTLSHLKKNLKKAQMLEDKFHEIEHQNRTLLQRMSDIMEKPSKTTDSRRKEAPHVHSLNLQRRRENLDRITNDNSHLLSRLKGMKPYYNVDAWEADHQKNHKIMKDIMEHEYLGDEPSGTPHRKTAKWVASGGSGVAAARAARSSRSGRPETSQPKPRRTHRRVLSAGSAESSSRLRAADSDHDAADAGTGPATAFTATSTATTSRSRSRNRTSSRGAASGRSHRHRQAHSRNRHRSSGSPAKSRSKPRRGSKRRHRRPRPERNARRVDGDDDDSPDDEVVELFRFPSLAIRGVEGHPDSAWDVSLFDTCEVGATSSVLVLQANKVTRTVTATLPIDRRSMNQIVRRNEPLRDVFKRFADCSLFCDIFFFFLCTLLINALTVMKFGNWLLG